MKNEECYSFEEALDELEQIVKDLEFGKETLDDSIKKYEKAHILKNFCLKKINESKLVIEKISQNDNGEIKIIEDDNII